MKKMTLILTLMCTLISSLGLAAQNEPTAEEIVQGMLDAVGGLEAFRQIGLLEIANSAEEIKTAGAISTEQELGVVSTLDLTSLRLEKPKLVVACSSKDGWAQVNGKLDERPQTSFMARATLHSFVFPYLLPYTLTMKDVTVALHSAGSWDGRDCWQLTVSFPTRFFAVASENTTWSVFVAKDDHSVIAAEYFPEGALRKSQPYGVRYRYERFEEVNGAKIPTLVVTEGLSFEGVPNGHTRLNNMKVRARDWDAALFINPQRLSDLEEGGTAD